ncbi:type II toxin-antitoxin system HicA family toxin [Pinirhizobacter sp.]|uniref:type II toxin-antitoxin system HicA family toxin n=1 Tax=Pinirhizobacter sp. TaxID=2950432 RepID=UPI0039C9F836
MPTRRSWTAVALMCKIHTISSADLIRLLRSHGFIVISTKGSHHKLRHADGRWTVVPHPRRDLGKGLIRAIFKQARL